MPDLIHASIQDIHSLYKQKQLTVRSLVFEFLSRIAKLDHCPGGLNSILEINPDALFIADTLDEKLRKNKEMPPLFGIPVLLKDNINTSDRLHTSAGSVALKDNFASCDAHIVSALRKAGALILGKANMTEFANYMSREGMPSGYSSRGGQVLNPFNRSVTPSGSSSGSAVAAAAGLCTVSIGTEKSGSIISPASHNGIVGIKPTLGLVGRSGIIPISGTLDTAGPMARSVRDAAVLLGVIAGSDPCDIATHTHIPPVQINYEKFLEKDGLRGMRIGINRFIKPDDSDLTEEGRAAFKNLCKVITEAGAVMIDNINIEPSSFAGKIMRYEFKACFNYYLSAFGTSSMKTLKDIIEYNQAHAEVALKYGQSILIDAENNTSGKLTESEYIEALNEREKTIVLLNKVFDENRLDIMLCETPTNIAPFTGFPVMTIPIGQRKDSLPVGSYWIARRFDETSLLKAAYAAEQALGVRLTPEGEGIRPA